MTSEHRRQCRAALWHWQLIERQPGPETECWAHALRQTAAYYERRGPPSGPAFWSSATAAT